MMDLPLISILGPFGGNQLITALDAVDAEARTAIGSYENGNLPRFDIM
jgi:hypothetical protein